MSKNKYITKGIIICIVLLVFSIGSLLLSLWIGDSMAILFNSVLDKYLNYTESMMCLWASALDRIFFWVFLGLMLISVVKLIKHKNIKMSVVQIIFISLFIVINIVFLIAVASCQANDIKTVDSISVKSYVDIHQVFDVSYDDESYSEQTNYGKVCSEIPVNYEIQQTTDEYSVFTSCIQITENSLLSEYYNEQLERFSIFNPKRLDQIQLEKISAEKGCFWNESENTLNILIIKDDKIYKIYLKGENQLENERLIKQLDSL